MGPNFGRGVNKQDATLVQKNAKSYQSQDKERNRLFYLVFADLTFGVVSQFHTISSVMHDRLPPFRLKDCTLRFGFKPSFQGNITACEQTQANNK